MHRRTARGNKLGLTLTGLVLALAGVALFLAHQGLLGAVATDKPLYSDQFRRFVGDNHDWLWPVVAAVAIVLGLLFLRWLLVQLRTDGLRRLVIDSDEHAGSDASVGRTRMPAHAVTDLVEDDVTAQRGVRRVSAALSGHGDAPALWLTVATDSDADIARIRREITSRIISDARTCLDLPSLPTYLRLNVSRRDGDRDVR